MKNTIPLFFLLLIFFSACKNEPGVISDQEQKADTIISNDLEIIPANNVIGKDTQDSPIQELNTAEDVTNVEKPNAENNYGMPPLDVDFLTGKWEGEGKADFDFSFWIYVEDGFVSGQYCAINEDASRIDCGTQEEVSNCYIKGDYPFDSDTIFLDIVSCYSLKQGKAILYLSGENLMWELTESPGEYGRDHFAPDKSLAIKTTFDVFE